MPFIPGALTQTSREAGEVQIIVAQQIPIFKADILFKYMDQFQMP